MRFSFCFHFILRECYHFDLYMVGMKVCVDILAFYGNNVLKINQNKITCINLHFLGSEASLQKQGEN